MKTKLPGYLISLSGIFLLTWTISCSGRSGNVKEGVRTPVPSVSEAASSKLISILSPAENTGFKLNQPVKVSLGLADKKMVPDSVAIYFNGIFVKSLKSAPWEYSIPSSFTVYTGRKSLKVTAFREGKLQNSVTRFMIIYSDIIPKKLGYKVIHTYPHNRDAFTQGLVYDKGVFFEGTGQETGSTLREVDPETGKVKRQLNLDNSLFGRGSHFLTTGSTR